MKVTLVQMQSRDNKTENLQQAEHFISEAASQDKPSIIVLPEMFAFHGGSVETAKQSAEELATLASSTGETYRLLSSLAKKFQVVIHGGSFIEYADHQFYNTTLVFNRDGSELVRYRKIHLFDACTPSGKQYKESDFFASGNQIAVYEVDGVKIGCSICFDLRFPMLYQRLRNEGCQIMMAPSSFTDETGKAHWEILCRARAIETQSFLVAPAQTGSYFRDGVERFTHGHSMVVDPWGNVIGELVGSTGFVTVDLDLSFLQQVRNRMVMSRHSS